LTLKNQLDPCGGSVEYLTVTLRGIGGDERGSLKSETVKYGRESKGLGPRKTALARASIIYKRQTVLSSKRAPHKNKTVTVKE
jgi:hypothetical protein